MKHPAVLMMALVTALTVGLTAAASGASSGTIGMRLDGTSQGVASAATPLPHAPRRPHAQNTSPQPQSVYVAVAPCRILDTRAAGGRFANGTTRTFYVGGTAGFPAQGGHSGGCGIPVGASSIAASIGVTNTRGDGYLSAWPANLTRPLASNLNYTSGQTIASGGTITITSGIAAAMKIANSVGSADVFVDVTGYYVQQIQDVILDDGTVFTGSSRIQSVQVISAGSYLVTVDSDVSYCTPTVDVLNPYRYGAAETASSQSEYVYTWVLDQSGKEVPTNEAFDLTITC